MSFVPAGHPGTWDRHPGTQMADEKETVQCGSPQIDKGSREVSTPV